MSLSFRTILPGLLIGLAFAVLNLVAWAWLALAWGLRDAIVEAGGGTWLQII